MAWRYSGFAMYPVYTNSEWSSLFEGTFVNRWLSFALFITLFVSVGCNGGCNLPDEPPADLVAYVTQAATNIRAANTFRLEITLSGADHFINVEVGENPSATIQVAFHRALAQYVADDELGAQVSVGSSVGRIDLDIYARDEDQWLRWANGPWLHVQFAPGFNPRALIAEDAGFQVALASLNNLEYIGPETLEDGTEVQHLSGTARGVDVTALLVGLIEAREDVTVDVYINCENYPARVVIRQPETVTESEPVPTTWTVDVYDINSEPALIKPENP